MLHKMGYEVCDACGRTIKEGDMSEYGICKHCAAEYEQDMEEIYGDEQIGEDEE